ncbi:putative deoxyribonuclease TATDN1 [Rhagoletis pomonella]|uniref:putative deoxyribonuclease TATDN1 n=1 Tax=Rhagoletis pomonella TaxID=28610 RepID=UPI00177DD742|nr:putative deoxyribonuclease TATDN1 [Rhagoletis pomonella]
MRISKQLKMVMKYIDIGANLTDPMFRGIYGGSQKHADDLHLVLNRAWIQGVQKMIITVGTLNEAEAALQLAKEDDRLNITMGCHPTRCNEFLPDPQQYYEGLRNKIRENPEKVVAVGECGLDYDRLHFCEKDTQKTYFEKQLSLAAEFRLPLFLHCRSAHADFMEILERNRDKLLNCGGGVVHSFDGTLEEAEKVINYGGLYIGLNGCSLKTAENLEVVKRISNECIMLETDCPWCGIRPSHAGAKFVQTKFTAVKKKEKWTPDTLVDGRCEPCQISQVLEVIAGVKEENASKLAETYYDNTMKLFKL